MEEQEEKQQREAEGKQAGARGGARRREAGGKQVSEEDEQLERGVWREAEEVEADEQLERGARRSDPKSLSELWKEYEFGIDGRKPAKNFTAQERNVTAGGTKQKYYRRNHVWKIIKRLINSGHNHHMACNKIHQVYGHDLSVTKIIAALIRDKHRYTPFDCHPNLRV